MGENSAVLTGFVNCSQEDSSAQSFLASWHPACLLPPFPYSLITEF